MQSTLAILVGATLASASILPRQYEENTQWTLSNVSFTSSVLDAGDGTSLYKFDINGNDQWSPITHCEKSIADNTELPTFDLTGCDDPMWSFALNKTGSTGAKGQYLLYISHFENADGHLTNNYTNCNTNNTVLPQSSPVYPGTVYTLDFGGSNFNVTFGATAPHDIFCP